MGLFLAGLAYLFLCFAVFAGASLPYQDAPPALLLKQRHEVDEAWKGVKVAALVAVASAAWLAVKIARARRTGQAR